MHTEKIKTKLLVDLIPRIKNYRGGFTLIRDLNQRRKGDNAPMVQLCLKGNEKTEFEKKRYEEKLKKKEIPDIKAFGAKIFVEEKEFMEKMMK